MTAASEVNWLTAEAALIARFGVDLYAAQRIVTPERDIATEWISPGHCSVVRDQTRFVCECGESFTLNTLATSARITSWLRQPNGSSQPNENHLIYARTDLDIPPCAHWYRIEL